MSMKSFTLRLPAEDLPSYRVWARSEGKTLSEWLRGVLAWYLAPEQRRLRVRRPAIIGARVRIQPHGRVGIPKRLLDALGVQPGDEVQLAEEDGTLVLTPVRSPIANDQAD
jgi:AbrB family looped-hinge helix DNA binding protein